MIVLEPIANKDDCPGDADDCPVSVLEPIANKDDCPVSVLSPKLSLRSYLLRLLRVLGHGDADASESMNDILAQARFYF